jgi:hypothetical protein
MKVQENVCLPGEINKTFTLLTLITMTGSAPAAKQPPSIQQSASEPIRYVRSEQTVKKFYHGALYQTAIEDSYIGLQCPGGITEGNGELPGNHMWNTWSVNKEDTSVS